jgi:hypothetical protein
MKISALVSLHPVGAVIVQGSRGRIPEIIAGSLGDVATVAQGNISLVRHVPPLETGAHASFQHHIALVTPFLSVLAAGAYSFFEGIQCARAYQLWKRVEQSENVPFDDLQRLLEQRQELIAVVGQPFVDQLAEASPEAAPQLVRTVERIAYKTMIQKVVSISMLVLGMLGNVLSTPTHGISSIFSYVSSSYFMIDLITRGRLSDRIGELFWRRHELAHTAPRELLSFV